MPIYVFVLRKCVNIPSLALHRSIVFAFTCLTRRHRMQETQWLSLVLNDEHCFVCWPCRLQVCYHDVTSGACTAAPTALCSATHAHLTQIHANPRGMSGDMRRTRFCNVVLFERVVWRLYGGWWSNRLQDPDSLTALSSDAACRELLELDDESGTCIASFEKCGGSSFSVSGSCCEESRCVVKNFWFAQCLTEEWAGMFQHLPGASCEFNNES